MRLTYILLEIKIRRLQPNQVIEVEYIEEIKENIGSLKLWFWAKYAINQILEENFITSCVDATGFGYLSLLKEIPQEMFGLGNWILTWSNSQTMESG